MRSRSVFAAVFLIGFSLAAPDAAAQTAAPAAVVAQGPSATPAGNGSGGTAVRSTDGRLVISAIEAPQGIRVDGVIDDKAWEGARPISGFVQSEPAGGQPATQQTEVRVAYDQNNLYIAAFCYDTGDLVVTDIRKDFASGSQDTFEVIIDTFGDRNNGFIFATNSEGARADSQVTNEGREVNASWDAVWNVRTRKLDQGWTVEMSIPFRSLRFQGGIEKVWGINFSRRVRRVNEVTYWSIVPRQFKISRLSLAGNLEGIPARSPGRNLQIKPYVLGSSVRATGTPRVPSPENAGNGDIGVDVKYGVMSSLTFDLTVNPDFAQSEADQQQVNLTQFDLFFPEKRDFFLENSGVFYVSGASRSLLGPNSATTSARADTDLYYFHSRRIGLTSAGTPIPIVGGARLTGQAGGVNIGFLNMQTQDSPTTPSNNYTVMRLRKSAYNNNAFFGGLVMQRQNTGAADDHNRVIGLDTNIRLFASVDIGASYFNTFTGELNPLWRESTVNDRSSFKASYLFEGRKYFTNGTFVQIGKDFNDELGYYPRVGIRKYSFDSGMRPRPKSLQAKGIREVFPHVTWHYFTNMSGEYIARDLHTAVSFYANNGSSLELSINPGGDTLERQTTIAGIVVPAGVYKTNNFRVNYSSDPSRLLSGGVLSTIGTNFISDERTVNVNLTIKPTYRFRTTIGIQRTSLKDDETQQEALRQIITNRTNYSFTTNMFIDALIQYEQHSSRLNSNIRFNFIHHPLSDLYIVYNDQRFTNDEALVPGRGFIVKFTRMFSF